MGRFLSGLRGGAAYIGEVGIYGAPADNGKTCDPTLDAVAYSATNIYAFGDMVLDSGFYYISDADNNRNNLLTNTAYWWKCTQFLYLDTSADNGANPGQVSTDPTVAKAHPFNSLTQVMQKTTGAYPTSMDVNSVVLFKRGQTYQGSIRNQATKSGYVDPITGTTAHGRYFYAPWGLAGSALPIIQFADINSYVQTNNATFQWACVGTRYFKLDFDGRDAYNMGITSSTGVNIGDTLTGTTTGAQYQLLAKNDPWNSWTVKNLLGTRLDFAVSEAFTASGGGSGVAGSYAGYRTSVITGPGGTLGYWKLMYCKVHNFQGNGVAMNWNAATDVNNFTAIGNTFTDTCAGGTGGAGIYGTGANHIIQRNTFRDNGRDETFSHAIYVTHINNSDISYNYMTLTATMKGNHAVIIHGFDNYDLKIHHNLADSMTSGIGLNDGYSVSNGVEEFHNCYIYNNILRNIGQYSAGGGLIFDIACCTNVWIYNNLCYNNKGVIAIQDRRGAVGDSGDSPSNGVYVHNNTFAFKTTGGYMQLNGAASLNFDIRNNIFYGQHATVGMFHKYSTLPAAQLTMFNNLFYNPNNATPVDWEVDGNSTVLHYNQTSFLSNTGKNTNGVQADPLFTNFGTFDLTLQGSSPAKTAGITTGLVGGYVADFSNIVMLPIPSLGCYK